MQIIFVRFFAFAAVLLYVVCGLQIFQKRRATRPKETRCARRKSHNMNWRRYNEAAATNRTAQESKTE